MGDFSRAATCILMVCKWSSASKRKISAASSPKSPVKAETGAAAWEAGWDGSTGNKGFAIGGGDAGTIGVGGGVKAGICCASLAGASNPANPVACRAWSTKFEVRGADDAGGISVCRNAGFNISPAPAVIRSRNSWRT